MLTLAKVGQKLKYLREKLGFSQDFVGRELGINRQAIIGIENGRRKIDSFELFKLLALYKVELNELMRNDGISPQSKMQECLMHLRNSTALGDEEKKALFEFQKICEDYEFLKQL